MKLHLRISETSVDAFFLRSATSARNPDSAAASACAARSRSASRGTRTRSRPSWARHRRSMPFQRETSSLHGLFFRADVQARTKPGWSSGRHGRTRLLAGLACFARAKGSSRGGACFARAKGSLHARSCARSAIVRFQHRHATLSPHAMASLLSRRSLLRVALRR